MSMINQVVFEGFLGADAVIRECGKKADGTPSYACNFSLGCSRPETKEQRDAYKATGQHQQTVSDFIPVTLFRNLQLTKGTRVIVVGRLRQGEKYTDKNGNQAYSPNYILADNVEILSSKPATQANNPAVMPGQQAQYTNTGVPTMPMPNTMPQGQPVQQSAYTMPQQTMPQGQAAPTYVPTGTPAMPQGQPVQQPAYTPAPQTMPQQDMSMPEQPQQVDYSQATIPGFNAVGGNLPFN